MYRRILVPLDGSELAEQALPFVEFMAKKLDSEVVLMNACVPGEPSRLLMKTYVDRKAEELRSLGIKVDALVVEGYCVIEILDFAESNKIDLVVITTHGSTGITRWPLGSTATKLMQASNIPVLLLRSLPPQKALIEREMRKILVPLDGSRLAEAVLRYVEELARRLDSEILLLEVIKPVKHPYFSAGSRDKEHEKRLMSRAEEAAKRYLDRREAALKERGLRVRSALLHGQAAEHILKYAEENSASLIAIATHGFSGVTKWVYGSVAANVIQSSSKPLLIVRPPLPGPPVRHHAESN